MMSSDPAAIIIGKLPLNGISYIPSRTSGTDSMMEKKIANSGASLPANATIGLPPAHASHARKLRRRNSEPTA
jgi:hypothetical protein